MLVKEFISKIEEKFPLSLQQDYDNSGMQIEGPNFELSNVLVTLDVTEQSVERAIETGAQMILSHHPMFFHPLKSIKAGNFRERMIYPIVMNSITVYSSHTNYDAAKMGLNDLLSEKLELKDTKPLIKMDDFGNGIGRIGSIRKQPIEEFVNFVKEKLEADHVKFAPAQSRDVERVAVCSGAGSDLLDIVLASDADLYITGDLSYHEIANAVQSGLSLIVVDHDETEKFFDDGMIEFASSLGVKTTKYHERFYWVI